MRIKRGFVVRSVGGQKYAVATGEVAKSFRGMLKINDMGEFIFNLLSENTTVDDVVSAILKEYDADENVVRVDVENFVSQLRTINIIED